MDFENFMGYVTAHEPRSHVNALVRHHHVFTDAERLQAAERAGWNVFEFPSEMLRGGDLLSDSGTTVLTSEQLAAMVLGDNAYGHNWGYDKLRESFEDVFGVTLGEEGAWEYYLFHQGRAAERALYSHLKGEGLVVPANAFFDTTRANAEQAGITALDIPVAKDAAGVSRNFLGNMDLDALSTLLWGRARSMPFALCTITNNTGGGQPVTLWNLERARFLCHVSGVAFLLDACRFAENAWFIKQHDHGCEAMSIPEIVRKQFALCDGFTISLKKDGLANMGGALFLRKQSPLIDRYPNLIEDLRVHQLLTEGHPTYGGISGRDIMAIAVGLRTVITEEYLAGRIRQVRAFGEYMRERGIPVMEPFGGHAIYIDTDRFYEGTGMKREDFGGISLTGLLLLKGVRLCELGAFAFGKQDSTSGHEIFPKHNFVRAAVPRNKYELQDLQYVADCVRALYERRDSIPRAVCVSAKDKPLRHFFARFRLEPRT